MKKILSIAVVVLIAFACTSKKEDAVRNLITVYDFETLAPTLVDSVVTIEGEILHVCRSGGKLFLAGDTGETKVKITPPAETKIDPELEGKKVTIVGILKEQRVDEAYLLDWEAKVNESDHADCQHEGEDHKHGEGEDHEESVVTDHHDASPELDKINNMRKQIATSGKGYLSFYYIEYQTITPKEEPKE